MAGQSFIQLNPDGNGKKLDTSVTGNGQHRQVVAIGHPTDDSKIVLPTAAGAVPVDPSGVVSPISVSALPLPAGAATSAAQATGNGSLATVATNTGKIPSPGQTTMSGSTPVAIASDQSNIPVTMGTRLDATNDSVTVLSFGNTSTPISTAATTQVKGTAGVLVRIIITGGTLGNISLYDATSATGTPFAAFDSTAGPGTYNFDSGLTTGLTVVTSAATKLTVVWR